MSIEHTFVPRPGQKDYTHERECPVINCVVQHEGNILVVKRSATMRYHPNKWNGISGFLDDEKSPEEKAIEELWQEVHISAESIISITQREVLHQQDDVLGKLWLVHPILVKVFSRKIILDWEAQAYKWLRPDDVYTFDLMPGFAEVMREFFH